MQTLINSLNNGITEYKDNGEIIQHPPTATMIRAAKALLELAKVNEANTQILVQQQNLITAQLQEIEQLSLALKQAQQSSPGIDVKKGPENEKTKEPNVSDNVSTDTSSITPDGQGV